MHAFIFTLKHELRHFRSINKQLFVLLVIFNLWYRKVSGSSGRCYQVPPSKSKWRYESPKYRQVGIHSGCVGCCNVHGACTSFPYSYLLCTGNTRTAVSHNLQSIHLESTNMSTGSKLDSTAYRAAAVQVRSLNLRVYIYNIYIYILYIYTYIYIYIYIYIY